MFHLVSSKLSVVGPTDAFSIPVSMEHANQVRFQVTLIDLKGMGGDVLFVTLQDGNDLQNWSDVFTMEVMEVGFTVEQTSAGIASRFVRLKFSFDGITGVSAIVAAGIETAEL